MMRQNARLALLTLVMVILEFGLGKYLAIGAACPRLTFCFVIIASTYEKNRENTLLVGLLAGIVCDLASGHGFGTYTILFGIVSWITGILCDNILSSRLIFIIINTFIMSVFAECVYFLLHIIEIGAAAFWPSFGSIIIPTAIYNMVVSLIIYKPVDIILKRG